MPGQPESHFAQNQYATQRCNEQQQFGQPRDEPIGSICTHLQHGNPPRSRQTNPGKSVVIVAAPKREAIVNDHSSESTREA
jgi:hypothetical protein